MEEQTKISISVVLAVAVAVVTSVWLLLIVLSSMTEVGELVDEEDEEWCLTQTIKSGDDIVEDSPGTYEYDLVITKKGIDVYRLCDTLD